MPQQLYLHRYDNGLTLLGERMDHVRSATFYAMTPAGFTQEPQELPGLAGVMAEMLPRGAGTRDSKELSQALDRLGVDRGESIGPFNLTCYAGTLARNLPAVLDLYADILRRPWLNEAELPAAQELAMQDLQSLADSPSEIVLLELKRRYYPTPFNRSHYGTPEGIAALTPDAIKSYAASRMQPRGAIFTAVGNIDWPALVDQVGQLFGDWRGTDLPPTVEGSALRSSTHIPKDTQQTQIAIAFPSAPFGSAEFYAARGAIGVLSGGMSARLFTEVREKRGLCYSVSASYDSMKDRAAVVCYAGTSADRAQQTLDVTVAELRRLKEGVTEDEVDRVKASLKTSLIMQQESTSSRASSMASDWFHLKRLRSIDEVQAGIDSLTPASILKYLEQYPVRDLVVVTLGSAPLVVPE